MELTINVQNLINKYDVFTFDVFDTLIVRDVRKPKMVFRLVERLYDEKHKVQSHFYQKRIIAERKARKRYSYTEVNLDEIYNELLQDLPEFVCNELKQIEIETEEIICTQNLKMKSFYSQVLKSGKPIYIITDMYLPKKVIHNILQKNGYSGYKDILVSGEWHVTKLQGALFRLFIERYNLKNKHVLHIGDNKQADYNSAKNNGIDACLYSRKRNWISHAIPSKIDCLRNNEYANLCLFIENHLQKRENDYFYQCGYSLFGPLIFGFTKWLIQEINKKHIDKVLFASRDGYILQKAYILVDGSKDNTYFYVSRKSIITALLHYDADLKSSLQRYKSWPYKFSFGLFINKMGLNENEIPDVDSYDMNTEFTKSEFLANEKIQEQFYKIKPIINEKSIDAERVLKKYIDEMQLTHKIVALVDLGGRRSIEKNIREFLNRNNINLNLYGCYLEIQDKAIHNVDAYLFTKEKNHKLYYVISSFYYFLEIILSAPHGSVRGYREEHKKIVPILEDNDYIEEDIEPSILESLQKGALDFCKDFKENINFYEFQADLAIRNLKKFGIVPNKFDIKYWKNFRFNTDTLMPLIYTDNNNKLKILREPKIFMEGYKKSLWQAGFLSKQFRTSKLNKAFVYIKMIIKSINWNRFYKDN